MSTCNNPPPRNGQCRAVLCCANLCLLCCVVHRRYHAQLNAERTELERVHSERLARLAAREEEVRSAAPTLVAAGSITSAPCSVL
jgi:hypothetical protein